MIALDENLVPGATYTFQFTCNNTFCLTNLSSTFQNDLVQQGPSFLGSLQVTSPPTTNLYNVQFTYGGDGSDVVSDVANSMIAAAQQVSGDSFVFAGAVSADASTITVTPGQAAQQVAQSIGKLGGSVVTGATSTIAQGAQNLLSPVEGVLILIVVLAVILIFTAGKSGGLSAGPTGVSIGG